MFIVTEIQMLAEGQIASITVAFENRREAQAKYHQILASACLSGLPCHSALLYTEEGFLIQSDYFRTEPEKQEEPEQQEETPAEEEEVPEEEETPEEDYHDPEPSQNETKEESESETMVEEEVPDDDNS